MLATLARAAGATMQNLNKHLALVVASAKSPMRPRELQVLLSNSVERPVPDRDFQRALEELISSGHARRVQGGPGGRIAANSPAEPATEVTGVVPSDYSLEQSLMPHVEKYLATTFASSEAGLSERAKIWLCDTSVGGPLGAGPWSRPDFTLVAATRFRFSRPPQLDVFGFELKPEMRCDIRAVHEAYAQTRFVHYGYLMWHLPASSRKRKSLSGIRTHCSDLGVGLIVFPDPSEAASFEVLVDPARKSPSPEALEAFLTHRVSAQKCAEIEEALRD